MKPTLGYPSRILAIRALRRRGMTETQIAAEIGIKPSTVTSIESRAKARGSNGKGATFRLRLSGETIIALHDEAEQRGMSAQQLAEWLLRMIATEDLVQAVLDN